MTLQSYPTLVIFIYLFSEQAVLGATCQACVTTGTSCLWPCDTNTLDSSAKIAAKKQDDGTRLTGGGWRPFDHPRNRLALSSVCLFFDSPLSIPEQIMWDRIYLFFCLNPINIQPNKAAPAGSVAGGHWSCTNNAINSRKKEYLESFPALNRSKTTFTADINIATWLKATTSNDPNLRRHLLKCG